MQITVADPQFQTLLFAVLFGGALLLSARRANRTEAFPPSLTRELKGFAILAVIFGHIGYALATDAAFLWPFSIMAGVGVNIFLFLSGLGLTLSAEKSALPPLQFYRKRFMPILVPLWIVLTVLYLAEYFVRHVAHTPLSVAESYLGIYPSAKMLTDLNSPLWYLTFLFACYLAFPFLYRKGHPYLSAFLMLAFGPLFAWLMYPLVGSTVWLYAVHCMAFPAGMVAARLLSRLPKRPVSAFVGPRVRTVVTVALAAVIAFTAVHSGVGHNSEQVISMVSTLAVAALFALLPVRFALLDLFGAYSYEIYLFHWPLLLRYDPLYGRLPAFLATALWLCVFVALGAALQRAAKPRTSAASAAPVAGARG